MRKHDMIYVFYGNLTLYDTSNHNHKLLKVEDCVITSSTINCLYHEGGFDRVIYDGQKGLTYDPPLPTNVFKEKSQISKPMESGIDTPYGYCKGGTVGNIHGTNYDPPLPTSVLQFKNERGKHKTQKPTTMMEWILKYYSKEGDTVLDPTMGSGSTGVSCKSMNR